MCRPCLSSSAPDDSHAAGNICGGTAFAPVALLLPWMKTMPDYSPPPALFEAIVRSATDYAIITLDASRRVTSWNPGASVLLGWGPAEIVGQNGDLIFPCNERGVRRVS
jgi:PAS domain-containing protein